MLRMFDIFKNVFRRERHSCPPVPKHIPFKVPSAPRTRAWIPRKPRQRAKCAQEQRTFDRLVRKHGRRKADKIERAFRDGVINRLPA